MKRVKALWNSIPQEKKGTNIVGEWRPLKAQPESAKKEDKSGVSYIQKKKKGNRTCIDFSTSLWNRTKAVPGFTKETYKVKKVFLLPSVFYEWCIRGLMSLGEYTLTLSYSEASTCSKFCCSPCQPVSKILPYYSSPDGSSLAPCLLSHWI